MDSASEALRSQLFDRVCLTCHCDVCVCVCVLVCVVVVVIVDFTIFNSGGTHINAQTVPTAIITI